MKRVEVEALRSLDDHAEYAHLTHAVEELRAAAAAAAPRLRGRTVWMVNSTAQGGGVAEMLPGMISHLRELGVAVEWRAIESDDDAFFQLTKRIHNLLHGHGEPGLGPADRELYERTNRANADAFDGELRDGDIVVVHDPQPMPLAALLRERADVRTVWRCHVGLDTQNAATRDAWGFLGRYAAAYDRAVFSAPEYVPDMFSACSTIIYPAVDPLTPKNQPLRVGAVVEVLERAGMLPQLGVCVEPPYLHRVRRLQPDGTFGAPLSPQDLCLLTRPLITQVSRWDRLKGFLPLMRGFARLKRDAQDRGAVSRRQELARLILAGPDPDSVTDDPEGSEVLDELRREYMACSPELQQDIGILALPMQDASVNALIVNALQRASTVVAQNSIREGFGLTITEAMWKGVPVLSSAAACGPRQQLRDGVDGRLVQQPEDAAEVAATLREMLSQPDRLEAWGRSAQRRVHDSFLIHAQLGQWLRLLADLT